MRLLLLASLLCPAGCGGSDATGPQGLGALSWHEVEWSGGTANVAVLPPAEAAGTGPHPVILALPWGSGSRDLVLSFLDRYWSLEPARRGYWVVALEGRASGLAQTGDALLPAVLRWIGEELGGDVERVSLVGASNGGRGVFFAAVSQPGRFRALIGLPGRFESPPAEAPSLLGVPVWLMVGELDAPWVAGAEETASVLRDAGVEVTLTVLPGQGHVLTVSPEVMMDFIDEANRR